MYYKFNNGTAIGRIVKINYAFTNAKGFSQIDLILETDIAKGNPYNRVKVNLPIVVFFKQDNARLTACYELQVGDYVECRFSLINAKNKNGKIVNYHQLQLFDFRYLNEDEINDYMQAMQYNSAFASGALTRPVQMYENSNGSYTARFCLAVQDPIRDKQGSYPVNFLSFSKHITKEDLKTYSFLRSLDAGTLLDVDYKIVPDWADEKYKNPDIYLKAFSIKLRSKKL